MMFRPAGALVLALVPAIISAQEAALMTGGGVARLDQLTSEPISTLGFMGAARLGPMKLDLTGSTTNYRDLGNDNRVRSALSLTGGRRGWRVAGGPALEMGSTIRESWTTAWSGAVSVARSIGRLNLEIRAAEGITRPDAQRVSFGRRGTSAGFNFGPARLAASYDVTVVRDSTLRDNVFFDPEVPGAEGSIFRDRVRQVHDAAIRLDFTLPSAAVVASIGRRRGDDIATQTFWRLGFDFPVAEVASIVFSTSRDAADVVLGLRGGRTTTIGFRLALPDAADRASLPKVVPVVVDRETAERVRVVLTLPGGSRARIMGEMTGWQPIELESIGHEKFQGWFLAKSGTYRINVALDDGPWITPPGIPRVEDGFGGMVGLLEL
jgi:hypothetical protein